MKYFINATITDPISGRVTQKLDYDVNVDGQVTVESAKTEMLQWVVVPKGYKLAKESTLINSKKRDLSFEITQGMILVYTATFEEIAKEKK